jgi:HTH-type transcriptional regulator/antitoxin HigA
MDPKLIKTEAEYQAALAQVDALMAAPAGSRDAATLELWAHLVEEYEATRYPISLPDPIAAIRFRMEQQGLKPADLIPYLGSKSRVSEVLSGKRPLSKTMIRGLHAGLGIPAEVLLAEPSRTLPADFAGIDWSTFPLSVIVRRRWFGAAVPSRQYLLDRAEEFLGPFLAPLLSTHAEASALRQTTRNGSTIDEKALLCWKARVWQLARDQHVGTYDSQVVTHQFISEVARLSVLDDGPTVAGEMLAKVGVCLIIEPPMPHTLLDGAAMRIDGSAPIVALTLRYDRLDNFWFTLCHELAHVALHLKDQQTDSILDNLDEIEDSDRERGANCTATQAMISEDDWAHFLRQGIPTPADVVRFARSMRLDPAIVAGRYRKETNNYKVFQPLIGSGRVRAMFAQLGRPIACEPSSA